MTNTTERKKPRIVAPKPPDTHAAQHDKDADEDYQFFAYQSPQRLEYLKKRVREREEALFELQCNAAMLEGNPSPGEHLTEAQRTMNVGAEGRTVIRPCECGACELTRLKVAIAGLEYGLLRLRALAATK